MKLSYAGAQEQRSVIWQESFGGLDMRLSAGEGDIAAMSNMTGNYFPVLSPRPLRWKKSHLSSPGGLGGGDKLFWANGTGFYYDGVRKGTVASGKKSFCCLGPWVTIWPDRKYYNSKTDTFGTLYAAVSATNAVFSSTESPTGLSSEANCLKMTGQSLSDFAPEEAVTIQGCSRTANNKTLVIREISGDCLYFYDNSFSLDFTMAYRVEDGLEAGDYYFEDALDGFYYRFTTTARIAGGYDLVMNREDSVMEKRTWGGALVESYALSMGRTAASTELDVEQRLLPETESGPVTVSREVPALEYVCQCDNRLWGVKDNSIYCCYLGNPRIWNNFETTATACWAAEVGSAGAFTGAFAYGGYPLLFKENHIYRIYGTKSADYQIVDTETLGSEAGSGQSFAVVGQTLYYKSRVGFVAYAGGVPKLVDAALGTTRRQNAVAGTDGRRYYVSCYDGDAWSLLVYDSQSGLWHREDEKQALDIVWCGGELHMLDSSGDIWMLGQVRSGSGTRETAVQSSCEFADMPGGSGGKDATQRLYFRLSAEDSLTVEIQYDSLGVWEKMTSISSTRKTVKTVELVPRRCDHFRLRLQGSGDWKLWALGREYVAGSRMGG